MGHDCEKMGWVVGWVVVVGLCVVVVVGWSVVVALGAKAAEEVVWLAQPFQTWRVVVVVVERDYAEVAQSAALEGAVVLMFVVVVVWEARPRQKPG